MNKFRSCQLAGGSRKVVMFVQGSCVNDSRVIKSAEALASAGWDVTVVCRLAGGLPAFEQRNGVEYHRISVPSAAWVQLIRKCRGKYKGLGARLVRKGKNILAQAGRLLGRAAGKSHGAADRAPLPSAASSGATQFLTVALHGSHWLDETLRFCRAAARYAQPLRPVIVHCHDLGTLPAGIAVAKSCGAKLVYDSHELEMHRNATYTAAVQRKRRAMETRGMQAADAVITVSDSIADHLANDYKIARPHVIFNSPDFGELAENVRNVRDDLGLPPDAPLAVYVGSVTVNRGIEQAVQALAHYPDLHFATVGPVREQTRHRALGLASQLGVADRFHVLSPVQPSEVVSYIRSADVSVLPIQNVCLSYYYCMPNKLLESVFAGVPVAVASLLELKKFVATHRVGLAMDETDPRSIAATIRQLVENRASYVLDAGERQAIADAYGWAAQADKLRAIYVALAR